MNSLHLLSYICVEQKNKRLSKKQFEKCKTDGSAMQTIAVLNSKGGSGKTTISINLASFYAQAGHNTVLVDYDSQGSSTFWVSTRAEEQPSIYCIPAYRQSARLTRSFQMRLPSAVERVIIDTPAAVTRQQLEEITNRSNFIIIPVLPSSIDLHAASGFIEQLSQLNRVRRGEVKLAVVASRVDANAKIYSTLEHYLQNTDVPFIAKIRDTQNYIHATNEGRGLFEVFPAHKVAQDKADWYPLINWIEQKEMFPEQESEQPLVQAV